MNYVYVILFNTEFDTHAPTFSLIIHFKNK